jgi:tetratricopeptide (TPR) repeat protein
VTLRPARLGLLLLAAPLAAQTAKPPASVPDLRAVAAMVERGELGPAEERLRRILAKGGGAAAHDLLGVVLVEQKRPEEAEHEFRQALAMDPGSLGAHQHIARLYLSQKRDAEATAELRQAARLGPLERDLGLELARIERAGAHPLRAEQQLRSVADRFGSVRALMELARLQSERRDAAGALASLRRARAIAPSSEEVLRASAEAALASGAPLVALRELEVLVRMCPTVGRYHYLHGTALLKAGDAVAAVEPLKEAERLEPGQAPTLIALGRALNSRQLYGEAKARLLRGLSLAPDDAIALAALAEAEEGLGELAEAEGHTQRALARPGAPPLARLVMGMVRAKQERYPEARDALLAASAADPGSAKAHYQLSLVYARLKDPARAQEQLEQYRLRTKEAERRVSEVRALTGLSLGGMQP